MIRYGFLWSHEHDGGLIEGSKDRPCAIVVAAPMDEGQVRVVVVPITHRLPGDAEASLELPATVCRALGLDEGRHWIRFDELNRFIWPGYDLRPRPGGRYDYGMLPQGLFEELRRKIVALSRARKGRVMPRDG